MPPSSTPGGRGADGGYAPWRDAENPGRKFRSRAPHSRRPFLFKCQVDPTLALLELSLEGTVREEEMRQFVEQALRAIRERMAPGRPIRVLADMSRLRAASPEAAEVLRQAQQAAMQAGMSRIAEVVSSEFTSLQLNRVARASGMERILRHFQDVEQARRWLLAEGETHDVA